jgi:hypothetical protein
MASRENGVTTNQTAKTMSTEADGKHHEARKIRI